MHISGTLTYLKLPTKKVTPNCTLIGSSFSHNPTSIGNYQLEKLKENGIVLICICFIISEVEILKYVCLLFITDILKTIQGVHV